MIKDCPEEVDEDNEDINKKLAGMTCVKIEDVVPLAGLTLVKDHSYNSETSEDSDDYKNGDSESDSSYDKSSSEEWTSDEDGEENGVRQTRIIGTQDIVCALKGGRLFRN